MKKFSHSTTAFFVGLSIVIVQVVTAISVYFALPDWASRGQFGDVFGSVNALFSGLAFTGLIYTVFLQREELALQRKELELTRQELQRSAQAQEQSELALRSQAEAASLSARMSATTALLAHYRAELKGLGIAYPGNDPRRAIVENLKSREASLLALLNSMYSQIAETEEKDD